MCFSANASFAASGALAVAGAATIGKAKSRRQIMYAAIPLIFSVQQAIEGLQWLASKDGASNPLLGYIFLFLALGVWPVYVPISVYLLENDAKRKQRLGYFIFLGAIIAAYSLIIMFSHPIGVLGQACCHLRYSFTLPYKWVVGAVYAVVTTGSLAFSSHRWVKIMGYLTFVSLLFTLLVALEASVSVWCFFSAVLSLVVFMHFYGTSRPKAQ